MTIHEKEASCINESIKKVDRFLTFVIGLSISFAFGIWAGIDYERRNTNTPVESNNVIDSLVSVNDSIKIKVEKLDSIKDAKIIEVSTLDNDSTLKLFYKLVSE